jgi:hypothetical protein
VLYSLVGRWLDLLLASDPPLARFRLAARATLSLALTGGILELFYRDGTIAPQVCVLGALIGMWNSLSIQNPNTGGRKVDTLLAPVAAMITVTLLTFLQAWSDIAGDAGFIAVGFAAVWARRFGPRGMGWGNVALFASLFSLFVKITPEMLPTSYAAIALSAIVAYIVRFAIVTDDAGWTLRVAFAAFCARARLVDSAHDRSLLHHQTWLNLTAVNVDELLAGKALAIPDEERRALRVSLLAAELAVERHNADAATCMALEPRINAASRAPKTGLTDGLISQISNVPPDTGGLKPTTRLALQVALGSALAMIVGTILPPHTWFWAVLTAFIVFNGTATSGEALRKTWARVVGTVIGVGAGFVLVDFLKGHPKVEIVLSLFGVFLAMYVFRVSYGIMTFFVTATVAMVYDVIGRPTVQLLDARLVETIIGALCGGAAATFVFPFRTHDVVEITAHDFATRLRAALDSSLSRLGGRSGGDESDALDAIRAFDVQFQVLVARLKPLKGAFRASWKPNPREMLDVAEEISVLARALAYRAISESNASPEEHGALTAARTRLDDALETGEALAGINAALPIVRELAGDNDAPKEEVATTSPTRG